MVSGIFLGVVVCLNVLWKFMTSKFPLLVVTVASQSSCQYNENFSNQRSANEKMSKKTSKPAGSSKEIAPIPAGKFGSGATPSSSSISATMTAAYFSPRPSPSSALAKDSGQKRKNALDSDNEFESGASDVGTWT